jgi:hypothetical protein
VLFARIPLASVARVAARGRPVARRGVGCCCSATCSAPTSGRGCWPRSDPDPVLEGVAYYHVGLFFNNFLPANIGGDLRAIADASRHGEPRAARLDRADRPHDRHAGARGLALVTTLPAIDAFHLRVVYLALVAFFALSVALVWAVFHPALLPALERLLARVGLGGLEPHLDDLARGSQASAASAAVLGC